MNIVSTFQVLTGAFKSSPNDESNTQSKKEEQRRRKILLSLSSSMLPLLIDVPVLSWTSFSKGSGISDEIYPTFQTKQAIASIVILSLEFLSTAAILLAKDMETLVSMLLYPILDKVHINNNSVVQEAARDAIWSIVVACDSPSVGCFLEDEAAHLFAEMFSRLRIPGGGTTADGDMSETLAVAATLTWVLEEMSKGDSKDNSQHLNKGAISILIDLCNTLINRVDHLSLDKKITEETIFQLTKLYSAILRYFMVFFEVYDNHGEDHPRNSDVNGSWLHCLSMFEKPSSGFHNQASSEADPKESDYNKMCTGSGARLNIGKPEVDLIGKIISRACYLLSNESLRVQISACESLTFAFRFLGSGCRKVRKCYRSQYIFFVSFSMESTHLESCGRRS